MLTFSPLWWIENVFNKRKRNLFFFFLKNSFFLFYRSTRSGNHLSGCCYRTRSGRSQYVRSFQSSSTEIRPVSHGSLPTKVKFTFSLFLFRSRRIEILLYWWGNETKRKRRKKPTREGNKMEGRLYHRAWLEWWIESFPKDAQSRRRRAE